MVLDSMKLVDAAASSTRIAKYKNPLDNPLTTSAKMPDKHVEVQQYFHFADGMEIWVPNIRQGRTRKIEWSCLVESDVPIRELVAAIAVDLLDHQIRIEYKECQAIMTVDRLTICCVKNTFEAVSVEEELRREFTEIMQEEFKRDSASLLGVRYEAKLAFPDFIVRKDWPFNAQYTPRSASGTEQVDTSFKRVYRLEYSTEDVIEMKRAYLLLKDSERLKRLFGEHACMVMAPERRSPTERRDGGDGANLEQYHRILRSHNALNLSCGTIPLSGVINPGFKVEARFWKKASKSRKDGVITLRDVLQMIQVPSADNSRGIQVFHGCFKSWTGGYEAAVTSTVPMAMAIAENLTAHTAGFIYGFMKHKGWTHDSISKLMRGSFQASDVMAAEHSSWNPKTGKVTSTSISGAERHLRGIEDSWVDMSLGLSDYEREQLNARVGENDMMAFNFVDGASVTSMGTKRSTGSADTASIWDSDDESEETSDGNGTSGEESTDGSEDDPEVQADEEAEEKMQTDEESRGLFHDESEDDEEMESEPDKKKATQQEQDSQMQDGWSDDEQNEVAFDSVQTPIKNLFPDDPTLVETLMELTAKGPLPPLAETLYAEYNLTVKSMAELLQMKTDITNAVEGGDFAATAKLEDVDSDLDSTRATLQGLEQQLKEALLDLAKASTSTTAHQAKSKEPENGEKSQSPAVNSHGSPAGAH